MDNHNALQRSYRPTGQLFPTLALILVGLLAVSAMGIDVFTLYWAQSNLQSASDAAALAGATYLNGVTFSGANAACSYATAAQNAACTYALNNGLQSAEIQSITPASDSRSITVNTTRIVPATVAPIIGFTHFTRNTTA